MIHTFIVLELFQTVLEFFKSFPHIFLFPRFNHDFCFKMWSNLFQNTASRVKKLKFASENKLVVLYL